MRGTGGGAAGGSHGGAADAGADHPVSPTRVAALQMVSAPEVAPNLELHVSTQAGVTNYQAANAFYELGARRVVLAREMDLQAVRDIRARIPELLEFASLSSKADARISSLSGGNQQKVIFGKWLERTGVIASHKPLPEKLTSSRALKEIADHAIICGYSYF